MKKALIGLSLMFCAINAPETQGFYDNTKMILAGLIDGTDDFYINEFCNALSEFAKTLDNKATKRFYDGRTNKSYMTTAQKYVQNNMVQLLLDGVWFRQFWRVCGNDPYVAKWFAKLYASLLYYDLSGFGKKSLPALAKNSEDVKMSTEGLLSKIIAGVTVDPKLEEGKRTVVTINRDNGKFTSMKVERHQRGRKVEERIEPGKVYRLDYNGLKGTLFDDLEKTIGSDTSLYERKLIKKKRRIISVAVRYLKKIHDILNLDPSAKHRAAVQALALPYELVYVLKTNDFLLNLIRGKKKGDREEKETPLLIGVGSGATSSTTTSTSSAAASPAAVSSNSPEAQTVTSSTAPSDPSEFTDQEDTIGSFKLLYLTDFNSKDEEDESEVALSTTTTSSNSSSSSPSSSSSSNSSSSIPNRSSSLPSGDTSLFFSGATSESTHPYTSVGMHGRQTIISEVGNGIPIDNSEPNSRLSPSRPNSSQMPEEMREEPDASALARVRLQQAPQSQLASTSS